MGVLPEFLVAYHRTWDDVPIGEGYDRARRKQADRQQRQQRMEKWQVRTQKVVKFLSPESSRVDDISPASSLQRSSVRMEELQASELRCGCGADLGGRRRSQRLVCQLCERVVCVACAPSSLCMEVLPNGWTEGKDVYGRKFWQQLDSGEMSFTQPQGGRLEGSVCKDCMSVVPRAREIQARLRAVSRRLEDMVDQSFFEPLKPLHMQSSALGSKLSLGSEKASRESEPRNAAEAVALAVAQCEAATAQITKLFAQEREQRQHAEAKVAKLVQSQTPVREERTCRLHSHVTKGNFKCFLDVRPSGQLKGTFSNNRHGNASPERMRRN